MKRSVEVGRHGLSVMLWTAFVVVLCCAVGIEFGRRGGAG